MLTDDQLRAMRDYVDAKLRRSKATMAMIDAARTHVDVAIIKELEDSRLADAMQFANVCRVLDRRLDSISKLN